MSTDIGTTKQAEYTSVYRMMPTACPSCGKQMTHKLYCKFLREMIESDGDTDKTFGIIGIKRMCCKIPFLTTISVMMRSTSDPLLDISDDTPEQRHVYIRRKKKRNKE